MALCKTFTENHQHDPFCCCTLDARWLEGVPAGNFLMRVPLPNIINVHQMQNQPCWGFQENQTFYQWLHQVSLSFSQFTEHHLLLFSSAQFIRTNFPWTFQWWGVKQKGCEAPWTALAPLWALFLRAHLSLSPPSPETSSSAEPFPSQELSVLACQDNTISSFSDQGTEN